MPDFLTAEILSIVAVGVAAGVTLGRSPLRSIRVATLFGFLVASIALLIHFVIRTFAVSQDYHWLFVPWVLSYCVSLLDLEAFLGALRTTKFRKFRSIKVLGLPTIEVVFRLLNYEYRSRIRKWLGEGYSTALIRIYLLLTIAYLGANVIGYSDFVLLVVTSVFSDAIVQWGGAALVVQSWSHTRTSFRPK